MAANMGGLDDDDFFNFLGFGLPTIIAYFESNAGILRFGKFSKAVSADGLAATGTDAFVFCPSES
jgi:hypothetical protein